MNKNIEHCVELIKEFEKVEDATVKSREEVGLSLFKEIVRIAKEKEIIWEFSHYGEEIYFLSFDKKLLEGPLENVSMYEMKLLPDTRFRVGVFVVGISATSLSALEVFVDKFGISRLDLSELDNVIDYYQEKTDGFRKTKERLEEKK